MSRPVKKSTLFYWLRECTTWAINTALFVLLLVLVALEPSLAALVMP